MPRLAILNIIIGFTAIFVASAGGAFLANDLSLTFVREGHFVASWQSVLLESAHGHVNLFSCLQILFGVTMPHSKLSMRMKLIQTGLFAGGLMAMGPLLVLRAWTGPEHSMDVLGMLIGIFLSGHLLAGASHVYGLTQNYLRR